jgi:hypothetical protein
MAILESATAEIKTAEWRIEVKFCVISLANRLLGADTQQQDAASRRLLRAGQR